MWNKSVFLLLGAVVLVAAQGNINKYLPPEDSPVPVQDNSFLAADNAPQEDISFVGQAAQGNEILSRPKDQPTDTHNHDHGEHDHDHHHEHWDLRESIPGEPGQDYPLHHSPPETGFSCDSRTVGYYADIASGCQSFHVCPGGDAPAQSFLCPNGTIFNQQTFACQWWNEVDCAASESAYSRNNEIGMVPLSSVMKVPVNQGLLKRPIVVPENDIQFQPQSSNDVEDRQYLPPVKPEVTQQQPVSKAPTRQRPTPAPVAPARQQPAFQSSVQPQVPIQTATLSPSIVDQKYNRPVTAVPQRRVPLRKDYLPPNKVTDVPAPRPEVSISQQSNQFSSVSQSQNKYLPPVQQTLAPVVQRAQPTTQRPIIRQQVTTINTNYQPVRTSSQFGQKTAGASSFAQTQQISNGGNSYNYQKPVITYSTPSATAAPQIITTPAPVRKTYVSQTQKPFIEQNFASVNTFSQNKQSSQQSFSQGSGYSYQQPSPASPVVTTVKQTYAPVTQKAVIQTGQQSLSVSNAFNKQSSFSKQSFSETEGYNYPKPAIPFPAPTQAPVRQTFATVTQAPVTQRPVVKEQSSVFQQSFSQTTGYAYQKPSVTFASPSTTAAPQTQRATQAPFRQTYAPITQTAATQRPVSAFSQQSFSSGSVVTQNKQSFSQTDGYNYQRPAVSFPSPSTTAAPQTVRITQQAQVIQTAPPQKPVAAFGAGQQQSFANSGTFTQNKQSSFSQQAISQSNGYNYPKPAVPFPGPSTAVPQTQRTYAPVTQTVAVQRPVNSFSSGIITQNKQSSFSQQSFGQNNGYNYQTSSFEAPSSTAAPITQQTTQATVRKTYAPVTQTVTVQRPSSAFGGQQSFSSGNTFNQNKQSSFAQQSFSQSTGYNNARPAVSFSYPSTTLAPQTTTQTIIRQTYAPVTQTIAAVKPAVVETSGSSYSQNKGQSFSSGNTFTSQNKQIQQSFSQTTGYNYQKPSISFTSPSTAAPTQAPVRQIFSQTVAPQQSINTVNQQTVGSFNQQSFSQSTGYNYQKPQIVTTAAPAITQAVPTYSSIPQQSFDENEGYSYRKPAVSFSDSSVFVKTQNVVQRTQNVAQTPVTIAATATPNVNQFAQQAQNVNSLSGVSVSLSSGSQQSNVQQIIQQAVVSSTAAPVITQTSAKADAPLQLKINHAGSQNFGATGFSQTSGFAQSSGYSTGVQSGASLQKHSEVSSSYLPPSSAQQGAALPPCQHFISKDPLDELQTPVVIGSPAPFASKPAAASASFSAQSFQLDGYDYPKPSIPFITPSNPRLKVENQPNLSPFAFLNANSNQNSITSNKYTEASFRTQQQSNQGAGHQEAFINAFNSAASSTNARSIQQGLPSLKQTQQISSQQQHSDFEIVPSISFSYELNSQKKRSAEKSEA